MYASSDSSLYVKIYDIEKVIIKYDDIYINNYIFKIYKSLFNHIALFKLNKIAIKY
jgi:hypothetical protein